MSAVDLRGAATRLVALRVLKDRIAEHDAALRQEARDEMLAGDRQTAVLPGPDGKPLVIGHVQLTKPRAAGVKAVVRDEAALLAWVKANRPGEVVESVRVSFKNALLEQVVKTGEVLPGVDIEESPAGEPMLTVKPVEGAVEAVELAWRDGLLALEGPAA